MVFCDVKNDVTDKSPDWPPDYHKTARTFQMQRRSTWDMNIQ